MSGSMWQLPSVETIRTPTSIMKEQASLLTSQSQNNLRGDVETSGSGSQIVSQMRIVVPAINFYTYDLLQYVQRPESVFPGYIHSNIHTESWQVLSNEDFVEHMRRILASPEVAQLLTSLLAQATAR